MRTGLIIAAVVVLALATVFAWMAVKKQSYVDYGDYIPEQRQADPDDDQLADKSPEYIPEMTVVRNVYGSDYYVNPSASVVSLDITGIKEEYDGLKDRIFPSFAEAISAARGLHAPVLPSIDMFDGHAKYTDDRIVKALELQLHDGGSIFPGGKQGFLRELLNELGNLAPNPHREAAIAFIGAAYRLGGGDTAFLGNGVNQAIDREIERFNGVELYAKPVGIYTEDDTLRLVFRRDRFLQYLFTGNSLMGSLALPHRPLEPACRIAEALNNRPDLLNAYIDYMLVSEKVTNPTCAYNLTDLLEFRQHWGCETALVDALEDPDAFNSILDRPVHFVPGGYSGVAFWPYSTSKETRLFNHVFQDYVPKDTRTMDTFTEAIKSGEVDLAPDSNSGWYDHQIFSLETLLLPQRGPEHMKLMMTGRYKQRLKKAFEAIATQRRETHIKQLAVHDGAQCSVDMSPKASFNIEPSPTHFLRTARAYVKLDGWLDEMLGEGARELAIGNTDIHGELTGATNLSYGIYLLNCNDLGLAPALEDGELLSLEGIEPAEPTEDELSRYYIAALPGTSPEVQAIEIALCKQAQAWLSNLSKEHSMLYDSRVIVPVHYGPESGTRNWAVVGVKLQRVEMEYAVPPRAVAVQEYLPDDHSVLPYMDTYGPAIDDNLPQATADLAKDTVDNDIYWENTDTLIPVYAFTEISLDGAPMTRAEFRAVCDDCNTEQEIIAALSGRKGLRSLLNAATMLGAAIILIILAINYRRRMKQFTANG